MNSRGRPGLAVSHDFPASNVATRVRETHGAQLETRPWTNEGMTYKRDWSVDRGGRSVSSTNGRVCSRVNRKVASR